MYVYQIKELDICCLPGGAWLQLFKRVNDHPDSCAIFVSLPSYAPDMNYLDKVFVDRRMAHSYSFLIADSF